MPRTGIRPHQIAGSGSRGAVVVDGVRAARQDDRPGAATLELGERGVVRQQLRVDVELADAAGDQLGELAAEVEDDDGPGRPRSPVAGLVVRRAVGGRRLERGLEIGLDLGVVGGQDAMSGIGGLAVDRLAAVRGIWSRGRVRGVSGRPDPAGSVAPVASVASVASANPPSVRRPGHTV